jgi:predicted RNase H-like nuclease
MKSYIGIDGCPSGWLVVRITEDDFVSLALYDNIQHIWNDYPDVHLILIDIPIGLPDSGNGMRVCDLEARKVLKPYRASSVYPVPCREALYAKNYSEASAVNRKLTGKGLSKQSWMISPKIREVDKFLLSNKDERGKLREIHPEVLFWALNGGRAMRHNKRTDAGFHERMAVIEKYNKSYAEILRGAKRIDFNISLVARLKYSRDDIVDAFAAAMTARLSNGNLRTLPESPPHDMSGLPMEMVYWKR